MSEKPNYLGFEDGEEVVLNKTIQHLSFHEGDIGIAKNLHVDEWVFYHKKTKSHAAFTSWGDGTHILSYCMPLHPREDEEIKSTPQQVATPVHPYKDSHDKLMNLLEKVKAARGNIALNIVEKRSHNERNRHLEDILADLANALADCYDIIPF